MANKKITQLTAATTNSGTDLLAMVEDPSGTPATKKIEFDDIFKRGTVTTSQPIIDASQTWDAGAVTFTGIKANFTDTASAADSLLLDLQVGAASKVQVKKAGHLSCSGIGFGSGTIGSITDESLRHYFSGTNFNFFVKDTRHTLGSNVIFGWGSSTTASTTADTALCRDAVATLAQRNAANAQTFNLYNTYTDASNYERLAITWDTNVATIQTEEAGTGTLRALKLTGANVDGNTYVSLLNNEASLAGNTTSRLQYGAVAVNGTLSWDSSGLRRYFTGDDLVIGKTSTNDYTSDAVPGDFTVSGIRATIKATPTNIVGGNAYFLGGDGASQAAGNAHGGNIYLRGGLAYGTGNDGNIYIGDANTTGIGFFDATPVAQQAGTGETTGFTAGSGTSVNDDSTFTGNVGTIAYRVNDIVKALKNYGLIDS